ncbi:MAG: PAS domain-containing protein [Nitrospirae bacterium]|nr:PAS domain-containing protein [Nitrospirota bacterium]
MTEPDKIPVLLVDDRPENLIALEALLGDMGIDLFKAESGNEALRLSLKHDFAIVLMDVRMPGMDGFETAELMRANPKTGRLPIIFVTAAMKDTEHQFKGYEAGAFDYLLKPVEPTFLRSKVRVFCDLYKQRRRIEMHEQQLETLVCERTAELNNTLNSLRESEDELNAFFSQALDGCFFMMLDYPVFWNDATDKEQMLDYVFAHQKITRINDAMLAQYGATREQMMGLTPNDLFEHDIGHGRALWRRFFDAGKLHVESYERKMDGTQMWIEGEYIALYDREGRITGHFGLQRDITARKKTDEALRKNNEMVEKIFSMTTTCIAYMDRDFNFIRVNKMYADADGNEPEYFIGRNHFELYPNEENEAIFRKVVETGEQHIAKAKPFEYRFHPERGTSHWDWSLTPIREQGGEVEAVLLSLVNVSERIIAQEELSNLNKALEQRVRERTAELQEKNAELERMNRLFVGRELRMIELKERIRQLEEGTGKVTPEA